MNIQPDFEEFLRLLEAESAQYMVVGGYAVGFHGFPRFTKDLDLFYRFSDDNLSRLRRVLRRFGFSDLELQPSLFEKGNIIKIGIEPVRIDLLNEIDGIDFDAAAQEIIKGMYGSVSVNFIGLRALIANKRASSLSQDLADLERLTKLG